MVCGSCARSVAIVLLATLAVPADALDPRLQAINDWLYVLQWDTGVTAGDVAGASFDLAVVDYSLDGGESGELTAQEVAALRGGGQIVLAYLSIGEAEDYRYYWDPAWADQPAPDPDAPSWLGPTNPDWAGNYKVRYWEAAWQAILFGTASGPSKSYLDRIVDQGFDGVYLDIVDAFYYWSEVNVERPRAQARQEMVTLVGALASYARTSRGRSDFLVVPQNALDIVWDEDENVDAVGLAYLAAIDAVGVEDLFYDETTPQPPADVGYRSAALAEYLSAGGESRRVLVVDYVWDAASPTGAANVDRYNDFEAETLAAGYVPYAAVRDRDLDEIVVVEAGGGFVEAQPKPGGGGVVFADGFESGDLTAWSSSVGGP